MLKRRPQCIVESYGKLWPAVLHNCRCHDAALPKQTTAYSEEGRIDVQGFARLQARRLPQELLQAKVRATFAALEYPASMRRLYQWSPDECILELYTNVSIFSSCHPDMPDLAVPAWADSPADFLQRHR